LSSTRRPWITAVALAILAAAVGTGPQSDRGEVVAVVAQTCTPALPSPSQPPGPNNPGTECLPAELPDLPYTPAAERYSVDFPMEPPAPKGHTNGFAIARFAVPIHADAGVVRIGSFIARRAVRLPSPVPRLSVDLLGNDRNFDANFDAKRTKLTFELNFRTGEGTAWEAPTCADANISLAPDQEYCHDALPLDGTDTGSQLRVASVRPGEFGRELDTVALRYRSKISVLEELPVARLSAPPIDGSLIVEIQRKGRACVRGSADGFPSMEMYQYLGDRVETLYISEEAAKPLPALSGVVGGRSIDTCAS
jgi:hypothetical protein